MSRCIARSFLLACLALAVSARAADETAKQADREALAQAVAAVEKAFNQGDAKALAACWTTEGQFVGPRGEQLVGRDKIEAAFAGFLAQHKDAKLRLAITSCRFLTDDVALVEMATAMTPPAELDAEPSSSAVFVKNDGHWLIGEMHESLHAVPSPHRHLLALSWMVGAWVEVAGPSAPVMHSTCEWTANGSYLIRKFTAETESGPAFGGTEVIGWDPRNRRIRSWTFKTDGSFGDSYWTRDGDLWQIDYSGTLANGDDVSATHLVAIDDVDTIEIQTSDRQINGERQPDLPAVLFKRQVAAAPKTDANEPPALPSQVLPK